MSTSDDYSQRFPDLPFTRWTTGAMASQAGFGCYRINSHNPEHEQALRKAIASGINVIDTSANYGDGAAEELLGKVLGSIQESTGASREELIIVSKAGYMQGRNYHRAYKREHQGHAFMHVVKFSEGLWHCIHPEFLEDQITRSLRHINTSYLDVYLLHNPEYFLIHSAREGVSLEDAREEFYHRIRLAFEYLESEVASGRILHYGISSNCFGHSSDAEDFVSLERCLSIAAEISESHHFKVAQMPLNLIETGAATEANQKDNSQTVLEFAASNGINVMVNRVLNAITQNSLVRLAEHAFTGSSAPSMSDIAEQLSELIAHEDEMLKNILPTLPFEEHSRETLADFLSPGTHLMHNWDKFESIEHWHDVESQYLKPRMNEAIEAVLHHPTPGLDEWIDGFRTKAEAVFRSVTHHYANKSQPRLHLIKEKTLEMFGDKFSSLSISQLAFLAARSTIGVTCALIGARRDQYVTEIVESLKMRTPSLTREKWEAMAGIAELV